MPIRLIVTNNGDRPISLREAPIHFYTAEGEQILAAEPEDVERLMTRKEREGGKIPMPSPIPAIRLKPKASIKEIEADFNTFEFSALVVAAALDPRGLSLLRCLRAGASARGRQPASAQIAGRR